MTHNLLASSKRSGWLAGAVAGVGLVLATVFVQFSPAAQSAAEPEFGVASFADVIEDVSPAVVNISVSKVERAMPTTGLRLAAADSPRSSSGAISVRVLRAVL